MLRPISVLNEYKYTLNDITVTVEGSSTKYTISADKVMQISIIHKYVEHICPYIKVNAVVDKDVYKLLSSVPEKITMNVSLYKYIASGTIQAKELVFSKTFKVLNEYEVQPSDTRLFSDTASSQNDKSVNNTTNQLPDASFYLIDSDNLSKYQKIKSYCLNGATVTDVIALMFADRGYNALLMNSIPGDSAGMKNIPTYNLMASLEYLNTKYGIFYTDYIFYMDIMETYLLDKINLGKAVRAGKPNSVKMYLETYGSAEAVTIGSIVDKQSHIINIGAEPTVNKIGNFLPYMSGTNIKAIDTNGNITTSAGVNDRAVLVFNQKIPKQLQHSVNESKIGITVGATSIDINAISPNLLFTVLANQNYDTVNKISGDYRLNGSQINLVQSDSKNFGLACTLELVSKV